MKDEHLSDLLGISVFVKILLNDFVVHFDERIAFIRRSGDICVHGNSC